ncbi:MAG TPA: hypothetical protein VN085_04155, partial [Vicinamibacterales bacterium]|nr:hypothetical protein [Vicinamibacterales bacterium]
RRGACGGRRAEGGVPSPEGSAPYSPPPERPIRPGGMSWFFERQHSKLRYEIRRQTDGHEYELVITGPDGSQAVERYADSLSLVRRAQALDQALRAEGWHVPVPSGRAMPRRFPARRAS